VAVNEEEDGDDDNTDGDGNVGLIMMIIDVSPSTNHDIIVSYHHSIEYTLPVEQCRARRSSCRPRPKSKSQITSKILEHVVCIVDVA
jgi:hypothetical protein